MSYVPDGVAAGTRKSRVYVPPPDWMLTQVTSRLAEISDDELLDLRVVAGILHLSAEMDLDSSMQPRGYRLLSKIPRLPELIADHVVERFGTLPKIMRASISDLVEVEEQLAHQLARFPQRCLREDRMSLLEQDALEQRAALANELEHGGRSLGEAQAGLERFRAGQGRHGSFR